MKQSKMHLLNTIIFAMVIFFAASCKGQSSPEGVTKSFIATDAPLAIGEVVDDLSNSILIIYQAANGDYWFGSDVDGAYHYDGKRIVHYSTSDGLCNNTIREIKEDAAGNIYFSTQHAGVSKFDGEKFTTLPVVKSVSANEHWRLHPGDLWFKGHTGSGGPCRYDGQYLYQLIFPKSYMEDDYYKTNGTRAWSPYDVYYIYEDRHGSIWFGTGSLGVCRYDGKTLSWIYEDQLQFVPGGGSFGIRSVMEDAAGKYWICNTRYRYDIMPGDSISQGYSLLRYRKETGIPMTAPDGNEEIYFMSVLEDANHDLWMATYGFGVWRYDGKEMKQYLVKEGSKVVTLFSIYQDRQGALWLGTHEAGAYKFNGEAFERFRL